jgi:hypothetical protein
MEDGTILFQYMISDAAQRMTQAMICLVLTQFTEDVKLNVS